MMRAKTVPSFLFLGAASSSSATSLAALRGKLVDVVDSGMTSTKTNLTLYHINSLRYPVNPVNMNTADLAGVLYFDLYEIFQIFFCADGTRPPAPGVICGNGEYNGGDIAVTKLVVEVAAGEGKEDQLYGPYATCNVCVNSSSPIRPSHKCTDGEYVCDCFEANEFPPRPAQCKDPSVGRESVETKFGPDGFGRLCGASGAMDRDGDTKKGVCANSVAAQLVGGFWYSTLDIGAEKTWRLVQIEKRVSKKCHFESFFGSVTSHGDNAGCFRKCPSYDGGDALTPCWAECLAIALLGPNATSGGYDPDGASGGMTKKELLEAYSRPFESSDPRSGGCPDVRLAR